MHGTTMKILHGVHIVFRGRIFFSEQTATFALYNINWLVFITEIESVYWAVWTECLYKIDTFRLWRVNTALRSYQYLDDLSTAILMFNLLKPTGYLMHQQV
jgi:hypothetical protein